jgi:hypothetical protein
VTGLHHCCVGACVLSRTCSVRRRAAGTWNFCCMPSVFSRAAFPLLCVEMGTPPSNALVDGNEINRTDGLVDIRMKCNWFDDAT